MTEPNSPLGHYPKETGSGWLFRYGVPAALVLYAVLAFGVGQARQNPLAALLISVGMYLVTVFLFAGIPALVVLGHRLPLAVGITASVGLSALWIGQGMVLYLWLMAWSLLLGTTVLTGYFAWSGRSFGAAYSVGILVVTVVGLAQYLPLYSMTAEIARNGVGGIVSSARMQMSAAGYSPDQAEEIASAFERLLNAAIRVMPAGFVLSSWMQYSLGYLWFSHRVLAPTGRPAVVPPFAQWKAPFGLAVAVLLGSAMRIFGNDSMHLIADNILVVLVVVYAVTGMALVESFLRRIQAGWMGRVFVLVALFLSQLLGLLLVALLGFIDSYVDWRARAQRSVDETR